jgi:hypothetical protein
MCCDYFFRPVLYRAATTATTTDMLLLNIHRHWGLSVVVMLNIKQYPIEYENRYNTVSHYFKKHPSLCLGHWIIFTY